LGLALLAGGCSPSGKKVQPQEAVEILITEAGVSGYRFALSAKPENISVEKHPGWTHQTKEFGALKGVLRVKIKFAQKYIILNEQNLKQNKERIVKETKGYRAIDELGIVSFSENPAIINIDWPLALPPSSVTVLAGDRKGSYELVVSEVKGISATFSLKKIIMQQELR